MTVTTTRAADYRTMARKYRNQRADMRVLKHLSLPPDKPKYDFRIAVYDAVVDWFDTMAAEAEQHGKPRYVTVHQGLDIATHLALAEDAERREQR